MRYKIQARQKLDHIEVKIEFWDWPFEKNFRLQHKGENVVQQFAVLEIRKSLQLLYVPGYSEKHKTYSTQTIKTDISRSEVIENLRIMNELLKRGLQEIL